MIDLSTDEPLVQLLERHGTERTERRKQQREAALRRRQQIKSNSPFPCRIKPIALAVRMVIGLMYYGKA